MEWETSPPPLGEKIEFQNDYGEIQVGVLQSAGSFGISVNMEEADNRKPLYRLIDESKAFNVLRWRKI